MASPPKSWHPKLAVELPKAAWIWRVCCSPKPRLRATAVDQFWGRGRCRSAGRMGKSGFDVRLVQVEDLTGVWNGRAGDEVLQSPFSAGVFDGSLAPTHS